MAEPSSPIKPTTPQNIPGPQGTSNAALLQQAATLTMLKQNLEQLLETLAQLKHGSKGTIKTTEK